jgi:hypothetical protein
VLGALDRLPIHHERNGVFGLRDAVVRLACRDSGRSARDDTGWDREILKNPAADIDMMRGQVIAERVFSSFCRRTLQSTNLISESFPAQARNVSS